ncbi:hypothetical protein RRG08_039459 [Elysia crispata]|uniref:Uncharacterized protein n=1 Tax=Elysia crispata TaxID=231223 RepID=A0AAE0YJX1_9GAST|nr:hypothetical protein RRG08_039459 [Elysia crispata]
MEVAGAGRVLFTAECEANSTWKKKKYWKPGCGVSVRVAAGQGVSASLEQVSYGEDFHPHNPNQGTSGKAPLTSAPVGEGALLTREIRTSLSSPYERPNDYVVEQSSATSPGPGAPTGRMAGEGGEMAGCGKSLATNGCSLESSQASSEAFVLA